MKPSKSVYGMYTTKINLLTFNLQWTDTSITRPVYLKNKTDISVYRPQEKQTRRIYPSIARIGLTLKKFHRWLLSMPQSYKSQPGGLYVYFMCQVM